MNSLVANYGADSDTDSSDSKNEDADTVETNVNLLTSENVATSDDEEDSDNNDDTYRHAVNYLKEKQKKSQGDDPTKTPLPAPALETKVTSTITNSHLQNSVFTNQFQKAEDAKLSVLEKHVKTTTAEKRNEIAGKKICWNYRKGKCRKGHRCQFAHDNDLPQHVEAQTGHKSSDNDFSTSQRMEKGDSFQIQQRTFIRENNFGECNFMEPARDPSDDSYTANMKRKKKHGVRDSLVPPKKALQDLQKQQAEERPWTVTN